MRIIQNPGLLAFQAVAERGTVHAASEALGLTQTAVTKRIQALESQLDLTLFIRSRRGMTLTEDGATLLRYCRSMVELEGLFISQVSGLDRAETSVTITGPTSVISGRIAQSCSRIYNKFKYLRLHLKSDDHGREIDLLRRGEADFAVTSTANIPNEMEGKKLKPERFLLLACQAWKGRKLGDILENERIIDFNEKDPVTTNYLKKFNLLSAVQRSRLFVNENEALIHLFRSGVGFGVLSEAVARPHLKNGDLVALNRGQTLDEPLALVWYPRSRSPDYFREIVRSIH